MQKAIVGQTVHVALSRQEHAPAEVIEIVDAKKGILKLRVQDHAAQHDAAISRPDEREIIAENDPSAARVDSWHAIEHVLTGGKSVH